MSADLIAAARAALVALDEAHAYCSWPSRDAIVGKHCKTAADRIRAALAAAPEQQGEPVAPTVDLPDRVVDWVATSVGYRSNDYANLYRFAGALKDEVIARLPAHCFAAAPAPAPICACTADLLLASYAGGAAPGGLHSRLTMHVDGVPVDYVPAPAPIAAPLTDEQIGDIFHAARNAKLGASRDNSAHRLSVVEIARAIERAHGIGAQPQPLTDEQIDAVTRQQWGHDAQMQAHRAYARAVLAAAGIGAQEQP